MQENDTSLDIFIGNELEKFSITNSTIAELRDKYMSLRINGLDDKKGYLMVKAARMDIKAKRIEVDKKRKALTEDALKFQRSINSEAKRITNALEPIENYLKDQEDIVESEKKRIKAEQESIKLAEEAERKAEYERFIVDKEQLAAERRAHEEQMAKERAEIQAEKERLHKGVSIFNQLRSPYPGKIALDEPADEVKEKIDDAKSEKPPLEQTNQQLDHLLKFRLTEEDGEQIVLSEIGFYDFDMLIKGKPLYLDVNPRIKIVLGNLNLKDIYTLFGDAFGDGSDVNEI